jgi:hypothetical protein
MPVLNHRCGVICCCLVTLMLSGCALIFGEHRSLIATIPAKSSSPVEFKAVLTMSTRYVEFTGFHNLPGDNQRLRISIINHGRAGFRAQHQDGQDVPVTPNTPVELYNAAIMKSAETIYFHVWGIERRTPCTILLEVSGPAEFRDGIKAYAFSSSAPM